MRLLCGARTFLSATSHDAQTRRDDREAARCLWPEVCASGGWRGPKTTERGTSPARSQPRYPKTPGLLRRRTLSLAGGFCVSGSWRVSRLVPNTGDWWGGADVVYCHQFLLFWGRCESPALVLYPPNRNPPVRATMTQRGVRSGGGPHELSEGGSGGFHQQGPLASMARTARLRVSFMASPVNG